MLIFRLIPFPEVGVSIWGRNIDIEIKPRLKKKGEGERGEVFVLGSKMLLETYPSHLGISEFGSQFYPDLSFLPIYMMGNK